MVDKFKEILKQIIAKKGPVTLMALMKMDDIVDKWSVVFSASWSSDEKGRNEAFKLIFDLTKDILDIDERNSIARIGIFPEKEHLIELLLQYQKDAKIENRKINGNFVHEAYILESNNKN